MDVCASSLYTLNRSNKIFLKLARIGEIFIGVILFRLQKGKEKSCDFPRCDCVSVKKVLWKIPQRLTRTFFGCREMKIMWKARIISRLVDFIFVDNYYYLFSRFVFFLESVCRSAHPWTVKASDSSVKQNTFSSFVCLHRERAAVIKVVLNLNCENRLWQLIMMMFKKNSRKKWLPRQWTSDQCELEQSPKSVFIRSVSSNA